MLLNCELLMTEMLKLVPSAICEAIKNAESGGRWPRLPGSMCSCAVW